MVDIKKFLKFIVLSQVVVLWKNYYINLLNKVSYESIKKSTTSFFEKKNTTVFLLFLAFIETFPTVNWLHFYSSMNTIEHINLVEVFLFRFFSQEIVIQFVHDEPNFCFWTFNFILPLNQFHLLKGRQIKLSNNESAIFEKKTCQL